jgi:hypothetical protein
MSTTARETQLPYEVPRALLLSDVRGAFINCASGSGDGSGCQTGWSAGLDCVGDGHQPEYSCSGSGLGN